MNSEVIKMITLATEDGNITEKEREIIKRKAQEIGADIDEVEILIDAELAKQKKAMNASAPKPKTSKGKVKKCPNCGSIITDSMITCPECGYDFSEQSTVNEDIEKRIELLSEKLISLDSEYGVLGALADPFGSTAKKKAHVISSFSLPITKEGLIRMLEFSFGRYVESRASCERGTDAPIFNAWKSKAQQSISMLKRYAAKDQQVVSIIDYYEKEIKKESKKLLPHQKFGLGVALFTIFFIILVIYLVYTV